MYNKTIRIKAVFAFFALCMMFLTVRLYVIQTGGIEDSRYVYSPGQGTELSGISFRGDILDRNGEPLVNREESYIFMIDKTKIDLRAESLIKQAGGKRIPAESRRYIGFKADDCSERVMEIIKAEYGGFVFVSTDRYSVPQIAAHIIGYCNRYDNTGVFGLERQFDNLLTPDEEISVVTDGAGRILPGYGMKYEVQKKAGAVKTTLDYNIQRMAEEILAKYAESGGAVVIADAKTGGILCSASYPSYDPEDVGSARGSSLINRALQASYPPGSVFKIIIAAASVESGIAEPGDIFHCSGCEDVYGVKISCSKKEGHGDITFEEGFAKSCNCVFIQLGMELGGKRLLDMAERFGLGKEVLEILREESPGILPDLSRLSGAGTANCSIGQGETEITCLQAVQIAGTIACLGKHPGLYLTEGNENPNKGKRVLNISTALTLRDMMCKVVEEGTGTGAGTASAGKSGSAQSYINGQKVVHGWYAGFFPTEKPEYIAAVFTESSGGATDSVKIFGEIHKMLTENNYSAEN
ncbi:MAG: penicillin-binding protein 2 [Bacillota bacterium]|nr:penicillin-binding protein 2 [Bacillota bacterium]